MKKLSLLAIALMVGAYSNVVASSCGSASHKHSQHETKATVAKIDTKVQMNIIETAVANESFNTLVTAVKAAGLVEALQGDGPFTVFAPTDDAFAALPEGTVESLLKDKEALTAILTYHVLEGQVMSSDVVKLDAAQTLNGQSVKIAVADETVMVNDARVVGTDIACSNGVIHVIDKVILPEKSQQ